MESFDFSKLGPYKTVCKALKPDSAKAPKRSNFEAFHKKQNYRFFQSTDTKRQDRLAEMKEHGKQRRSQLFMNSRKPNMTEITNELNAFIHEGDSNVEVSAVDPPFDPDSMEKEKPISSKTPEESQKEKVEVLGSGGKNANNNENENQSKNGSSNRGNNKTVITNTKPSGRQQQPQPSSSKEPPARVKDSRREQLLKWKKEKEASGQAAKRTQRQPFKAGAAGTTTTAPVPATNKNLNLKSTSSTTSQSKTTINTATSNANSKTFVSGPPKAGVTSANTRQRPAAVQPARTQAPVANNETRRVTRAMSKVQAGATNGGAPASRTTGRNGTANGVSTASEKLKRLNINEKPAAVSKVGTSTAASSKAGTTTRGLAKPTQVRNGIQTSASSRPAVGKTTPSAVQKGKSQAQGTKPLVKSPSLATTSEEVLDNANNNNSAEKDGPNATAKSSEEKEVAPQVVKKVKPKAIDRTYSVYNSKFSDACNVLNSYTDTWKKVLEETPDIPEKAHGDILSSLGQVKLLLESKLPQFGQLLFSYLCQEADPQPLRPCDLQGWWDVASIQLEAVDETFKKLHQRKDNNWEETPPVISAAEKIEPVKTCPPKVVPHRPPKIKAQASGGLRAFLANQRKLKQGGNPSEGSTTSESAMNVDPVSEDKSLPRTSSGTNDLEDKTFDGGFFQVNSPKPPVTPGGRRRGELRQSESSESCWGTPMGNTLSAVPPALRTPSSHSRRSSSASSITSHRRASMCMLRVRDSMGALSRIGVSKLENKEDEPASDVISDITVVVENQSSNPENGEESMEVTLVV